VVAVLLCVGACRRSHPLAVAEPDLPELDLSSQPPQVRQAAECAAGILRKEHHLGDRPLLLRVASTPEGSWTVRFAGRGKDQGIVEVSVSRALGGEQQAILYFGSCPQS
jgi:hypothetical protein